MNTESYEHIDWRKECESYTRIDTQLTGLPVDLYLDDGAATESFNHPVVVFMQNSYNIYDFNAKVPISADSKVRNVQHKQIKIYHRDYVKVRLWIYYHLKYIKLLSDRQIDVFTLYKLLKKEKEEKKAVTESYSLNEMAILHGSLFGIDYDIWIDNGQIWRQSGHAPRLKIQPPQRPKNSNNWYPFSMEDMEFLTDNGKRDASKYKKKSLNDIKEFIKGNKKVFDDIITQSRLWSMDEIYEKIRSLDDIRENPDIYTKDEDVAVIIPLQPVTNDNRYSVVMDKNNHKYAIYDKNTSSVVSDWFDKTIIPYKNTDSNGDYFRAVDNDGNQHKFYLKK